MVPTHPRPPGARAPAEEEAMYVKIPVVHPRAIEMSRSTRAFAVSLGGSCGAPGPAPERAEEPTRSEHACCVPHVLAVGAESILGAGGFGVKRPLRFLAYKLDLTEHQITELAAILDELKTE